MRSVLLILVIPFRLEHLALSVVVIISFVKSHLDHTPEYQLEFPLSITASLLLFR